MSTWKARPGRARLARRGTRPAFPAPDQPGRRRAAQPIQEWNLEIPCTPPVPAALFRCCGTHACSAPPPAARRRGLSQHPRGAGGSRSDHGQRFVRALWRIRLRSGGRAPPSPGKPPGPRCSRCRRPRERPRSWSRRKRSSAETAERVPDALKADFAKLNEVAAGRADRPGGVFQRPVPGRHGPRDQVAGCQLPVEHRKRLRGPAGESGALRP